MGVDKTMQHERFMRLFVAHERDVLRYVLAVVPHLPDARDILQETAVALWRKMDEYDPARPFLPWACRFAAIEISRFLRRADQARRLLDAAAAEAVLALQEERAAYLAGRASAEETARLSELLRADAAARDYYLETADVHAALAADESVWGRPVAGTAVPLPLPEGLPSRYLVWKVGLAAVGVGLALVAGLWGLNRFSGTARNVRPEGSRPALAVVTRTIDAQWAGVAETPREGIELGAGPLRLQHGMAQVDLYAGARLVLVGPVDLAIRSAREVHLAHGQLTCEVDAPGRGFRVSAPGMEVVDLGTVFGVRVPEQGRPEVHVLEGKVGVALTGASRFTEVHQAGAVRLTNGVFVSASFSSAAFPRSTDLKRREDVAAALRFRAWREAAAALAHDPAVLVHFTFAGEPGAPDGAVRNLAQSSQRGSDGMIIGARPAEGRWPGKRALEFRGRADRVLFRVPGAHGSLTFCAWLRVDAYQELVTALLVTEESRCWQGVENGQMPVALAELPYLPLRWELRNDGQLALNWQRADPSSGKGWHIHWADTDLKPDRLGAWTLLATVVDGARGEVGHYVNGREVGRRPAMIESPFALTRLCLGNMSSTEAEARAGIRYGFFGRMDEVIVANRVFGQAQIQSLYETGKP